MPFTPKFSPTAQIHDAIIAALKANSTVTAAISADRIGTMWDNRITLGPTNIRVFADDDGEEMESVGPQVYTFTLAVSIITAQDLLPAEIQAPLVTPHDVHESICGAVWYAFHDKAIAIPSVSGLTPSGNMAFLGRGTGSDSRDWFQDTYAWTFPYSIPTT